MIDVTADIAIEKIKKIPLVSVTWVLKNCPTCNQIEETLQNLHHKIPEWDFYIVRLENHKESLGGHLYFEPSQYPVNFLFKDGIRKAAAIGTAPEDEILKTLKSIEDGTFKTDEELEQEQLDTLE